MKSESKNQIYEVALYRITDEVKDNFPELNRKTINYLSKFDGYISSETYQSISNPKLYLDIVLWEALHYALTL